MTYKEHFKKNLSLALPVMMTQAGQILVNVVDNVMVGGLGGKYDSITNIELGKTALGAVSLGNAVFIMVLVLAFGFSFAMSPLIAAADAKNKTKRAANYFTHGLVLNVSLAIILFLIIQFSLPVLNHLNQAPNVVEKAIPYLSIVTMSMIPLMIFQSFRQLSEGLSLTVPVTIATLLGNILNIFLNYGWIYGNMGFPRLEVDGAAWGTFVSRIFMIFSLLIVMLYWKKAKNYLQEINFKSFKPLIFKKLLTLGIPTALTSFFEMSAFSAAAFICGYTFSNDLIEEQIATTNLAAHQIAINLASITFMMCMGLGVAATVRVGNQLGLKNYKLLRQVGWSTVYMVIIFMFTCGLIIISFRFTLPALYVDNQMVIDLAAQLLIIAAFFQLSDGIQLVLLGALRGMQDVNIPFIITFISYWLIAIPLGVILAITFEMRAFGVWIGLGVGLAVSSLLLLLRYHKQTKKLIHANT